MSIGANIKKYRLAANMTQKALAEKCGIADSAVRKYESGKMKPKLEMSYRLASALSVRLEDLIGLETFDTGEDFDRRWKEVVYPVKKQETDTLTVIHTNSPKNMIDFSFDLLNELGQKEAAKRIAELTEIPKYRRL